MAKPNYAFAKRQKDLAKKAKKAEKEARKRDHSTKQGEANVPPAPQDSAETA